MARALLFNLATCWGKRAMEHRITILAADRNRHVRELLKRELMQVGCRVFLAKTAQEIIDHLFGPQTPDLLIIDPDLPDRGNLTALKQVPRRFPSLPIVLHMHSSDAPGWGEMGKIEIVEKTGSSIERVKTIVSQIIGQRQSVHHRSPGPSVEKNR
jgi:DNA-binding NtrC family response regulator